MIDIQELTIKDLSKLLDKGKITSAELVEMYKERIVVYDKSGPSLNSILEINPDVIYIAEAMDNERKFKGARSILHGIPIVVKDNINTADKMHTSAGSLALADLYSPNDAFIIEKLREKGAIILGKTNMTEFANFVSDKMPDGYSSRGGQVLNPYNPKITPSGSSSGSAVAVTANFCAGALGTETNGSIISPSRSNCIVGIKPTVGLVSRAGIIPISNSQDTPGPMARTVEDAAIILGAIAGIDKKDAATWKSKNLVYDDYLQFIGKDIKEKRIGIFKEKGEKLGKEEKSALNEAISVLKANGAEIVEIKLDYSDNDYTTVSLYEFKSGINYYLSTVRGYTNIKNIDDIVEFNRKNAKTCLKYGQKMLKLSQKTSGTLTETEYIKARVKNIRMSRHNGIDTVIDKFNLNAIMTTEITSITAIAGYPSITVPAGAIEAGNHMSMIFMGKAFTEPDLISISYVYEQATKKRKPPVLR